MRAKALFAAFLVLVMLSCAFGQKLPDKIRGYKVYDANVRVENATETGSFRQTDNSDAWIRIGEPNFVDIGLSGVTFEIGAEIGSDSHSGKVDLLTFSDVRINGIAVDVEEYSHSFSFNKGTAVTLPNPVRGTIRFTGIAKAAYKELMGSKKDWAITGTVFVYGKFKKYGFSFKRVVPIKFDLKIQNPLEP